MAAAMPDTRIVLDSIVGVAGLVIGLASLYLEMRNRRAVSTADQRPKDSRFRTQANFDDELAQEPMADAESLLTGQEQPEDWIERQRRAHKRESDEWHAEFRRESDEWRARLANSFALLAAVCLAVGCVAYILAVGTESHPQSPGALAWAAAALGFAAAALGGMGFLQWGLLDNRERGAPLALLVVVAGGVLVVFALRLLS